MATYNQFGQIDDDAFEMEWEQDDDEDQEEIKPGLFQRWQAKFIDAYNRLEKQKYVVGKMSPQIQTEWVALIDKGQQLKYNINRINKFLGLKQLAGMDSLGIAPVVLIPAILGGGFVITMMMKFISDTTLNLTRYKVNKDLTDRLTAKCTTQDCVIKAVKIATKITNERHPPSYGLIKDIERLIKKMYLPLIVIAGIILIPKLLKK
ncbi:MAG: hypothetical protein V3U02_12595 [Calditrichia bacterium]